MTKREIGKRVAMRYSCMVVACFFYAMSLDLFLVPNNIVGGGIMGIATISNLLLGFNVGVVTIVLNLPILLLGLKTQGPVFILRCFATSLLLGLMTDFFVFLPPITDNPLLAAMYGGLFQGVSIGLFVKYSVSSGGTELLARLVRIKVPSVSIPTLLAVIDAVIVVSGAVVMRNLENVLYAMILIFISAKVSDMIITGLNHAKLCYIITDHPNEVSACLLQSSPHGVTNIAGTGMYTRTPRGVLMTCVKSGQLAQLKAVVNSADENAFIIVSETTEVRGKGFDDAQEMV